MTQTHRHALSGPHTIATIAATRDGLLAAMAEHEDLLIDCAGVTEADLTLLQVLLAARASAQRAGRRLRLGGALQGGLGAVLADAGYAPRPGQPGETSFWLGETE